jgi:hypothetical protein
MLFLGIIIKAFAVGAADGLARSLRPDTITGVKIQ